MSILSTMCITGNSNEELFIPGFGSERFCLQIRDHKVPVSKEQRFFYRSLTLIPAIETCFCIYHEHYLHRVPVATEQLLPQTKKNSGNNWLKELRVCNFCKRAVVFVDVALILIYYMSSINNDLDVQCPLVMLKIKLPR